MGFDGAARVECTSLAVTPATSGRPRAWTNSGSGRGPRSRSPPRCVYPPIATPKPMPAPPGGWDSDGRKVRRDITIGRRAPRRRQHPDYVWACHVLGYANPDLTLHAAQVRDWYGSEDGLDLRALDADCAALEAAVAATEDALTRQDDQLGALSAVWQGRSADLSREFLRRHGEASAAAAAAVRTAADALATLRDNLWHTVDGKVAATISADPAPGEWLAAAQTVTTGAGDRAAASERIDQEVKPFVDNNIRAEWLTSMRSAMAAVMALYDVATAELTAEPDAVFEVPGELGPSWTPPPRDDEVATVPAAATRVLLGLLPPGLLARRLVVRPLLVVRRQRGPLRLRERSFRHRQLRHRQLRRRRLRHRRHRLSIPRRWRLRRCRRWAAECLMWEVDCPASEGSSATCLVA